MVINWTGQNHYVQSSIITYPYGTISSGDIFGPVMVYAGFGR